VPLLLLVLVLLRLPLMLKRTKARNNLELDFYKKSFPKRGRIFFDQNLSLV
jgi:hypothetical protein